MRKSFIVSAVAAALGSIMMIGQAAQAATWKYAME
jgi:hypothetical protein